MAEKVTIMVLKVDLQCTKCYKKVKKILCKFPQIRDQIYDEKANTVTIVVVCCSPEKIRDKLCYKGNGAIKSIEIKEPEKKKDPVPVLVPVPDKPKAEPEKPKSKPVETPVVVADKPKDKPKHVVFVDPPAAAAPKSAMKAPDSGPAPAKASDSAAPPKAPTSAPAPIVQDSAPAPKAQESAAVAGYPPAYSGYGVYYETPCYNGYGMPMQMQPQLPPLCNCGCGRSVCHGYNRGYAVNRCDYFSEENPAGCRVM